MSSPRDMPLLARAFWLLFLPVFLGACSSYRQFNPVDDGSGDEFGLAEEIHSGDQVRLTLDDGMTVEGIVVRVGEVEIALVDLADEDRVRSIDWHDVVTVERYSKSSAGYIVLAISVLVIVGFATWDMEISPNQ